MIKSKPHAVVISWLIWVVFCLILIFTGFVWIMGWIKLPIDDEIRVMIGAVFALTGLLAAYFGTLKFFWYIVNMLSHGKVKNNFGRNGAGRGPKIVVIGGGTGLGTILRGLKEITSNLTAIVTVADDGGSSGRLRREFGILPPGDIRNCLVAMADIEPLMEKLMQYRFGTETVFAGHNFGNLFLTVLTNVTGDFEKAIKESSKVLAVRGQVLPATLEHVSLKAEFSDGSTVIGESAIAKKGLPIERVSLEPRNSKPVTESIVAIKEADIILLGPGSLYTSIIPNLLVEDITKAIRSSNAIKVYICNAMTQLGETDNYSASDHIRAIEKHAGKNLLDMAIVNTSNIPKDVLDRYAEEGAKPVKADLEKIRAMGVTPVGLEIIRQGNVIRHDAEKLAEWVDDLARTRKIEKLFGKFTVRNIFK